MDRFVCISINAKWVIFQLHHDQSKLHFNEMMMSRQLDFYSTSSLKQQQVDIPLHFKTHYPDSKPTSIYFYSINAAYTGRSNEY